MKRLKMSVLFSLACAGFVAPGMAQERPSSLCKTKETIPQCWDRLLEGGANAASVDAVAKKTTGSEALGKGLTTTTTDFLSPIATMLGFDRTVNEVGDVAFESNVRFPPGDGARFKLGALVRRPTVLKEISDGLPAATRTARTEALKKQIGDLDDVRLGITWNLENASYGRSIENSRGLYDTYFRKLVQDPGVDAARLKKVALLNELASLKQVQPACTTMTFKCFVVEGEARRLFDLAVNASRTSSELLEAKIKDAGLDSFLDLISNQPQLMIEAAWNIRDELAGPSEGSIQLRYEKGFATVNGLRSFCAKQSIAQDDVACLQKYVGSKGGSVASGKRAFVTAEVSKRNPYSLILPEDSLSIIRPRVWGGSVSAGFGLYVRPSQAGRLDVAAEAMFYDKDPVRPNRATINATYTQKLSDGMTLAAGISWASKPEFLADVDKKLSATVGLRYRLTK